MRNEIEQQPDEHHSVDWATTRPVVSGSGGVISSGHPLVSMAGMRMLLSAGNAFEAAAAAGFASRSGSYPKNCCQRKNLAVLSPALGV